MSDLDEWVNDVHTGDSLDLLTELPSESVHAVITDPPYGLAFMGRDWDDFEPKEYQEWCAEWAGLARRVLKPGGHLLAFSGNRTHHRLFSGVEDAGFEIRDTLTWHYGSGFPKALDVSKAIDKAAGAEREVVGKGKWYGRVPNGRKEEGGDEKYGVDERTDDECNVVTAPATDAAREWDGWKTALKPATEFVVLARKPFSGTVAENVQAHGTGALNIDACRIEADDGGWTRQGDVPDIRGGNYSNDQGERIGDPEDVREMHDQGRYPANTVFGEVAAKSLDDEVGQLSSGVIEPHHEVEAESTRNCYGEYGSRNAEEIKTIGDTGGPSRYYYTSKATRAERTMNGKIQNPHPTVKPLDLMEWLTKLTTKQNQVILDPFTGTGTTLRAAKNHGRQFIGIEKQPRWADIARARTGLTPQNPDRFTEEQQTTLRELGAADGGDA